MLLFSSTSTAIKDVKKRNRVKRSGVCIAPPVSLILIFLIEVKRFFRSMRDGPKPRANDTVLINSRSYNGRSTFGIFPRALLLTATNFPNEYSRALNNLPARNNHKMTKLVLHRNYRKLSRRVALNSNTFTRVNWPCKL